MITAEEARALQTDVPMGHGWAISTSYPTWVVFYDSEGRAVHVADAPDRQTARLIAAAPDLAATVIAQAAELAIARSGKARFLADFNDTAAELATLRAREERARALLPAWEHEAQVDHDSSQHHYASVAVARRLQALRDQRRDCADGLRAALDDPEPEPQPEALDVPSVAVGAGERAPWEDLPLTCPECGEGPLPLQASKPAGWLSFITHCGKSWVRGPFWPDRRGE